MQNRLTSNMAKEDFFVAVKTHASSAILLSRIGVAKVNKMVDLV